MLHVHRYSVGRLVCALSPSQEHHCYYCSCPSCVSCQGAIDVGVSVARQGTTPPHRGAFLSPPRRDPSPSALPSCVLVFRTNASFRRVERLLAFRKLRGTSVMPGRLDDPAYSRLILNLEGILKQITIADAEVSTVRNSNVKHISSEVDAITTMLSDIKATTKSAHVALARVHVGERSWPRIILWTLFSLRFRLHLSAPWSWSAARPRVLPTTVKASAL